MIIKIKTFRGETLYLPEEDYLEEIMYSDLEEREFAKKDLIGYGLKKKNAREIQAFRKTLADMARSARKDGESPREIEELLKRGKSAINSYKGQVKDEAVIDRLVRNINDEGKRAAESANAHLRLRNRATDKRWKMNISRDMSGRDAAAYLEESFNNGKIAQRRLDAAKERVKNRIPEKYKDRIWVG